MSFLVKLGLGNWDLHDGPEVIYLHPAVDLSEMPQGYGCTRSKTADDEALIQGTSKPSQAITTGVDRIVLSLAGMLGLVLLF